MPRSPVLPLVAILGCLAGCVAAPERVYVQAPRPPGPPPQVVVSYPPIPAPRAEVIPPPPPRREYVAWQPGHWHWNGYAYDWLGGRYVEKVVGATRWEPGHWATRPGGYGWVPGRWA